MAIQVKRLSDGKIGTMSESAFDPNKYAKVGESNVNSEPNLLQQTGNIAGGIGSFLFPQTSKLPQVASQTIRDRQLLAQDPAMQGMVKSPQQFGQRLNTILGADQALGKQAAASGGEIGATLASGALNKAPVLGGATVGAIQGLLNPENQSLGQTALNTGIGGAVGGAIGLVVKGGQKIFNWASNVGHDLKLKAANQLIGQTPAKVQLNEQGDNVLSEQLIKHLDAGDIKPGNFSSMRGDAQNLLKSSSSQLDDILKSSNVNTKVSLEELTKPLDDLVKIAENANDDTFANTVKTWKEGWAKKITGRFGNELNPQQVNQVKIELYKRLSSSAFSKSAEELSAAKTSAMRAVSHEAMAWLRDNVDGAAQALDNEQFSIRFTNALTDQLKRAGAQGLPRGSAGSLNIFNLLGGLATAPIRSPQVLSQGININAPSLPSKIGPYLQNLLTQKSMQALQQ